MIKSLVIDTSFLLNLLASGRDTEILEALNFRLVAAPKLREEARYLLGAPGEDGEPVRERVDLSALEAGGLLVTRVIAGPALDAFVRCAEKLRDADAGPVALAGASKLPLASDDKRQRNVARELFPEIELLSTLQVLRNAAKQLQLDRSSLGRVARDIRERASFLPPKSDPDREWFLGLLSAES